jgi:hypothetical protein
MSSTPASSAKTSSASTADPACASCVGLLMELLSRTDTRPNRLLAALGSGQSIDSQTAQQVPAAALDWQTTADGVQVKIPVAPLPPTRQWNAAKATSQTEVLPPPSGAVLQATSSASLSTATTADDGSANSPTAEKMEWLQISCRPCANTGPEAGARAFVMGPTPLSMVVCTNRLLQHSSVHSSRPAALAEMTEILTHELVHVYDVRQLQLNLRDCENLAYSEVRAARQAECLGAWSPSSCTRLKAQRATRNLFPTSARQCIRKVFDRAYADTRPFANHKDDTADETSPRQGTSGR